MDKQVQKFMNQFLKKRERRRKLVAALAVLSMGVVTSVSWSLHMNGESYTGQLYCDLEENHIHSEECYEKELTCGKEETKPEEETTVEAGEGQSEAKAEGHVHDDSCYAKTLICGKEENHHHSAQCYSNPNDVEDEASWFEAVKAVKKGEDFGAYVADLAISQVGYKEKEDNFQVETNSEGNEVYKGYTRYGHWLGSYVKALYEKQTGSTVDDELVYEYRYWDWDTMLIDFILNYAGATDRNFPIAEDALSLYEGLVKVDKDNSKSYTSQKEQAEVDGQDPSTVVAPEVVVRDVDASDFEAKAGDLVFFDKNNDGEVDAAGIVSGVEMVKPEGSDAEYKVLKVVEGNYTPATTEGSGIDCVAENEYRYSDLKKNHVVAFGVIPKAFSSQEADPSDPFNYQGGYKEAEDAGAVYAADDSEESLEEPGIAAVAEEESATDPENTVINLFNYRVDKPDNDNEKGWNEDNEYWVNNNGNGYNYDYLHSGINSEGNNKNNGSGSITEGFKFGKPLDANGESNYANGYVGNQQQYRTGLVEKKLNANGYPVVNYNKNINRVQNNLYTDLEYLFNPSEFQYSTRAEANAGGKGDKTYKYAVTDTKGLLRYKDGYWMFNSANDFAELNEETKQFTYAKRAAVDYRDSGSQQTSYGQFFPFNTYAYVTKTSSGNHGNENTPANDKKARPGHSANTSWADSGEALDHYFGLSLTTEFVQKYGGYISPSKEDVVRFYFSGDDDVWIYIDGVLVGDLGGIHQKCGVQIDFSTGEITYYWDYNVNGTPRSYVSGGTIRECFRNAGMEGSTTWSGNTFENNTRHQLKMFYLERGGSASNLALQFNMYASLPNYLYKTDQYNQPVAGAKFEVEGKDGKTYSAITEADGKIVFKKDDGIQMSIRDMEKTFCDQDGYFTLKEVSTPDGYRKVSSEIRMQIVNETLLSVEPFKSGVWSQTTARVYSPNKLYQPGGQGNPIYQPGDPEGTLFAMVLKKGDVGGTASNQYFDQWTPVIGSDTTGYTYYTKHSGETDNLEAVKRAFNEARSNPSKYGDLILKNISSSGTATLENLPGDIKDYYSYIDQTGGDAPRDSEYFIAFYYIDRNNNIQRVESLGNGKSDDFYIEWAARIDVPNIQNILLFQKVDSNGNKVKAHTAFALYDATEHSDGTVIYHSMNNTNIVLNPDDDGDNEGTVARIADQPVTGYTYKVFDNYNFADVIDDGGYIDYPQAGHIYIYDGNGNQVYEIAPTTNARGDVLIAATHEDCDAVAYGGAGHFGMLKNGTYVLREVKAPKGFRINSAESKVVVNDEGVFANAGTEDDGVRVYIDPGYLVDTMRMFATQGVVNESLAWITDSLQVLDGQKFSDLGTNTSNLLSSTTYAGNDGATTAKPIGNNIKNVQNIDDVPTTSELLRNYMAFYNPDDVVSLQGQESNGGLFDYIVNTDTSYSRGSGLTGINSPVLGVEKGWSNIKVFQDTNYGQYKNSEHPNECEYQELDGDLSHLYVPATFVEVTDKTDATVKLLKVNEGTTTPLDGAEFVLSTNIDGVDTYWKDGKFDPSATQSTAEKFISHTEGNKPGYFELPNLIEGSYKLEEVNAPYGYLIKSGSIYFTIEAVTTQYPDASPTLKPTVNTKPVVKYGTSEESLKDAIELNAETPSPYDVYYDGGDSAYQFMFSVENQKTGLDINVSKVDGNTTPPTRGLQGAYFVLYKNVEATTETAAHKEYYSRLSNYESTASGTAQVYEWVEETQAINDKLKPSSCDPSDTLTKNLLFTGAETTGTFKIKDLTEGTYYLREIKSPDGYALLTHDIVITVARGADGKLYATVSKDTGFPDSSNPENGVITADTSGDIPVYSFDVKNESYNLPATGGGYGYPHYFLMGMMFMTLPAGYILLSRKKRLF